MALRQGISEPCYRKKMGGNYAKTRKPQSYRYCENMGGNYAKTTKSQYNSLKESERELYQGTGISQLE